MESFYEFSLEFIRSLQQAGGLEGVFQAITQLGDEEFYLLLVPLVFWCVDFGLGFRMTIVFLLASFASLGLKDLFEQPRPFDIDPSLKLAEAMGFGFPSGHALSTTVVWGIIAAWVNRRWFWALAIVLMLLVGFSRIYLGIHFPTDVIGGWTIGGVIVVLYLMLRPKIESGIASVPFGAQIALAAIVPLALAAIHATDETLASMATLAGIGVGAAVSFRYVHFDVSGIWWQLALRFILGIVILALVFFGLRLVFPGEESSFYAGLRVVRYLLVGLWVSLGAPLLFGLVGLAPEPHESVTQN